MALSGLYLLITFADDEQRITTGRNVNTLMDYAYRLVHEPGYAYDAIDGPNPFPVRSVHIYEYNGFGQRGRLLAVCS